MDVYICKLARLGSSHGWERPRKTTMKRFAAWVAWIAAAAPAIGAQSGPAHVNFGYVGLATVPAFRIDDACYISAEVPKEWGWQVASEADGNYRITIGDRTIEVHARRVEGVTTLPLTEIARLLDADAEWRPHADILDFTSRVRVVRLMNGHLDISTSLPVESHVDFTSKPGSMILNIEGATLSPDALVDVVSGLVVSAPKQGEIRVVLPVKTPFAVDPKLNYPVSEIDLDTTLAILPTSVPVEETLKLVGETDSALDLSLQLPTKLSRPPEFSRVDANTLKITLQGVTVNLAPDSASTQSIQHVEANLTPTGTELVFTLIRPMGVTLSTEAGLHIRFVKPPVGDGQLAGKVIVVDAGHGGKDSGTKALSDGLTEKSLTLSVSKLLAADLAAQGATVIMTRQTDVFIPLEERAAIANRNHANLFLCVHINSNGKDRSSSGTITFYHNRDPISSTLADCIQREITKASGMPGIGTWSDTKIYGIGFSVLRNIKMPGVLMELGFMNNQSDRKHLVSPDVQKSIAEAIVKGVQVYLGQPSEHEK